METSNNKGELFETYTGVGICADKNKIIKIIWRRIMLNITLRLEEPRDYNIVEEITYRAFLTADHASGTEALLAHKLRTDSAFVRELDFVAVVDGEVVGNIMYTKSKVVSRDGIETETLTFGPLSVKPEMQKHGIGAALVRHTMSLAKDMGFRAVIIFGHESYYPRFGFAPCAKYNITTADGQNFDAFMADPLYDGAFDGVTGSFHDTPLFKETDTAEFKTESEEFNSRFKA
jgi:predicted N-acetyltransferase YhbS